MERNFNKAVEIVKFALTVKGELKHTEVNSVSIYIGNDDQHPGMNLDNEYFSLAWRGYEIVFSYHKLLRIEYPDTAESWLFDLPNWLDDALVAVKGGEPYEHDYSVQVAVDNAPGELQVPTRDPQDAQDIVTLEEANHELELRVAELTGQLLVHRQFVPSTTKVTYEA